MQRENPKSIKCNLICETKSCREKNMPMNHECLLQKSAKMTSKKANFGPSVITEIPGNT